MEKVGKSGPLVETDLEFLGYHNVKREPPQDFGCHQQRCRIFKAHIRAGITEHIHWFVYLLTECIDEDIRNVEEAVLGKRSIFAEEKCYIVIPESMSGRNVLTQLKDKDRVYVFEELMWEKVQQAFSEYIQGDADRIRNLQAEYYVEPQVEEHRGSPLSLKNLSDMFSGKSADESIVVIKADAGVGKTTLAAKIASKLAEQWKKSRVIPLLLTGQTNWRELGERARNVTNLGDILILLLEASGSEFPLRQTEQFTRIMQLGYFALIFDGFDELTKTGEATPFSPQENFDWLASIAKDSSTRIMLTTRHSFWDREINESTAKNHKILRLEPFDPEGVSKYFKQYFSGKEKSDVLYGKAKSFYSELQKSQGNNANGNSFFNLPACAMMIAHQIGKGGDNNGIITENTTQEDPSRELFLQILRRENIRQQTQVQAENMHKVFENIAVTSNVFTLDYIVTDPECEIKPEDIDKIVDHAFLKENNNRSGEFLFKTDFLLHYMQASYVRRHIMGKQESLLNECRKNKELRKLIEGEADGSGYLIERVSHVLDIPDMGKVVDLHKKCVGGQLDWMQSFLFHIIAKTVISRMHNESQKERGDTIRSLLIGRDEQHVTNLHIRGKISEVYLVDWEIRDSSFVDFSLEKGKHNSGLWFINCKFSGSLTLPNDSRARFENCTSDGAARLALNQVGSAEITKEDIRNHLKLILSRFWFRRRLRARTISEDDWNTGRTTVIEQSYSLLDMLNRENLIEKHKHYPRLQIKKDAINDIKEFMENGIIQGRVESVLIRMENKIHMQ